MDIFNVDIDKLDNDTLMSALNQIIEILANRKTPESHNIKTIGSFAFNKCNGVKDFVFVGAVIDNQQTENIGELNDAEKLS